MGTKIGCGGNGSGNESGDKNRILIQAEKEDGADGQTRSSASGDGKTGKKSKTENGGNDKNSNDRDKATTLKRVTPNNSKVKANLPTQKLEEANVPPGSTKRQDHLR